MIKVGSKVILGTNISESPWEVGTVQSIHHRNVNGDPLLYVTFDNPSKFRAGIYIPQSIVEGNLQRVDETIVRLLDLRDEVIRANGDQG